MSTGADTQVSDLAFVLGLNFTRLYRGQQITKDTKQCTTGSTVAECNAQDPTAAPTVVSQDLYIEGAEVMLQWRALENLLLTGMTELRSSDKTPQPYFNSGGEPEGGVQQHLGNIIDYTLRLDWTPEIPLGYLLVHLDFVFEEPEVLDDTGDPVYVTAGCMTRTRNYSAHVSSGPTRPRTLRSRCGAEICRTTKLQKTRST